MGRRSPLLAALGLLLLAGCAAPTSVLRLPSCVERVEVQGQHARRDETTLVFDHTFDLPFTRTLVVVEGEDGVKEEIEIVHSEPDFIRFFAGGALYAVGAVLFTSAALDVAAGTSALRPRPLASILWGGAAVSLGTAAAATGWHPPHSTLLEDRCGS